MKKLSKITESIWSDMQDRSAGDVVRREDDVNLMSGEDFCDYLNDNYICKDGYRTYKIYYVSKVLHITVLKKFINVSYSIKYDYKTNMIYLNDDIEDFVPELCQKLKNNFKVVKKRVGDSYIKFIIYPPDGSECTNRFFVDVINFIIENGDENVLLFKKKHINESIWSDMQDRSAGDIIRKEDDNNNLRKLKPIDLGKHTTVYWADEDLEYDGETYFTFDEALELIKKSKWRLPTLKEVAELDVFSNIGKINPSEYNDKYVIDGEDSSGNPSQLVFFNKGLIYHLAKDRITDIDKYYYGWTSNLYDNHTAHIFSFDYSKIIHSPINNKRVVEQVIQQTVDKCCIMINAV